MPQLDKIIFLDQVVGVIIFFFAIYFINVYIILPKIGFILKFRSKKLKNLKYDNLQLVDTFFLMKKKDILNMHKFLLVLLSYLKLSYLNLKYYNIAVNNIKKYKN